MEPRTRVQKSFKGPSLAHQSFRKECDVNTIMERFQKTGLMEHVNRHSGDYGDYAGAQDYHSSLNQVLEAQTMFESLPSSIRGRFLNDPGQFLSFVSDPDNEDEMITLGLSRKAADADPAPAEPVTPQPTEEVPPEASSEPPLPLKRR